MSGNVAITIDVELLALDLLVLDPGLQCRAAIDPAVVAEYAELVRSGTSFPPVAVVRVDGAHLVTDGWHRVHAHRAAGQAEIAALVVDGSRREAMLQAVKANSSHGLQRTQGDKRRAVRLLLMDPEWARLSGRDLGTLAGVSHTFVDQARARYRVKRNTVLSEARACEVDDEPAAAWRDLLARAPTWAREEIEKIRTAQEPGHLVGLRGYGHTSEALTLRQEELAREPWPWPEDITLDDKLTRCRGLDSEVSLTLALKARECPEREQLYAVLKNAVAIDRASESWAFDALRRDLVGRPALVAHVDARAAAVQAKKRTAPKQPWQIADEIHAMDNPADQAQAIQDITSDEVFHHLSGRRLHAKVRDGAYKARIAPDGADDCVVPGCFGWVVPDRHYLRCAHCGEGQSQWLEQTGKALLRTAAVLNGSPDWSVEVEDGDVVLSQKALNVLRWLQHWSERVREDEMPDELLDLVAEWKRDEPAHLVQPLRPDVVEVEVEEEGVDTDEQAEDVAGGDDVEAA